MAAVAAILALVAAPAAFAVEGVTERQRQTVYNGQVFDGVGYRGQFYPQNEPTIFLLADAANVLIPKVTDVYWWPITREYKADWEGTDESLTGMLEVGDLTFPMTVHSLRYDGGYGSATTDLLAGQTAVQAYASYEGARDGYRLAVDRYQDDVVEFNDRLQAWGAEIDRRQAAGLPTNDLPPPSQPQPPVQPTVTVTEPQPGIAFSLPAGEYQMRLRASDGTVIAGSERRVVAFHPRRDGIAYKVIAASKYTLPDASSDPDDVIFVSGEAALYIQPSPQREYDAFYAAELLAPQQRSVQDRREVWSWLPAGESSTDTLSLRVNGGPPQIVAADIYYAKQRPGAALGYEIVPYDESAGAGVSTFVAFEVRPQPGVMTITAPDVPGSTREIRVVESGRGGALVGLAAVPLLAGLTWVGYRRWRTR